jgi:hypothetical protein
MIRMIKRDEKDELLTGSLLGTRHGDRWTFGDGRDVLWLGVDGGRDLVDGDAR